MSSLFIAISRCVYYSSYGLHQHMIGASLQSHKTEALAGKLSAVYTIMTTPDFIKQRKSHTVHKSQVGQYPEFAPLASHDFLLAHMLATGRRHYS